MTTLKTVCLFILGGLGVFHTAFANHTSDGVFGAGICLPLQAKAQQLAEETTCPLVVDLVFSRPNDCPPPRMFCNTTCELTGPASRVCNMPLVSTGDTVIMDEEWIGIEYLPFFMEIREQESGNKILMQVTPYEPLDDCDGWYFHIQYAQSSWELIENTGLAGMGVAGFYVISPAEDTVAYMLLDPMSGIVRINNLSAGYHYRMLENCRFVLTLCDPEQFPGPRGTSDNPLRGLVNNGAQPTTHTNRLNNHHSPEAGAPNWSFTNPINNQLEIRFDHTLTNETEVTLFDLRGAQLARYTLEPGQMAYSFPITDLPAGAYAVRLSQGSHIQTRMAIKY
jgi:hypothetical protein